MSVQMLYKILNDVVSPGPTHNKNVIPHYDLRGYHTHNIYALHCQSDTFKHSFSPEKIESWNNLPPQITTSPSLTILKTIYTCIYCGV